jgi:hypothetical protein
MDDVLKEFLIATQRCIEQLEIMIPLEQEKYQALISDNLEQIEEMIQSQQASIMKLKSLEAHRVNCQEKAGFGHLNADQILQSLSEDDKAVFSKTFSKMRKTAQELRLCNAKAMEISRASMVFWQNMDPHQKPPVSAKVTYGAKGPSPARMGAGSLFQTKI